MYAGDIGILESGISLLKAIQKTFFKEFNLTFQQPSKIALKRVIKELGASKTKTETNDGCVCEAKF